MAFVLSHPSSKNIMTLDRSKLFEECRKIHKSFHEWPKWINQTLTRIVLNEKYNKAQNPSQAMTESVRIQEKIQTGRSSRRSPNTNSLNLTSQSGSNSSRSGVGAYSRTTVPIPESPAEYNLEELMTATKEKPAVKN